MCLNLYDHQASRCNYGSTDLNIMVTTNQKHATDSHTHTHTHTHTHRTELKHTIKENHQAIKEEQKEEMNKEEHKQLENKV